MVDKTIQALIDDASPLLQRVMLNTQRRPAKEIVKKLRADDVKVLRSLLKEKKVEPNIQQDKIAAVLSERDQSIETANVLKAVLTDTARPAALRTVAAVELAEMPLQIAEPALLKHIGDPSVAVAHRSLMSLAKIGGEKTLKKLSKESPPENRLLRQQWQFTQRLIQHRMGISRGLDITERGSNWEAGENQMPAALPVEAIDARRLKQCISEIQGKIKDVEWAEDRGLTVSSDGVTTHVFLNKQLSSESGRQEISKTPMVAAAIAIWDERAKKPVIEQLALISPFEQQLLVQGYRLDGVQVFEGHATLDDTDLSFTLTSTDHSGQCRFRAAGYLRAEGLVLQAQSMERHKSRTTHTAAEASI